VGAYWIAGAGAPLSISDPAKGTEMEASPNIHNLSGESSPAEATLL